MLENVSVIQGLIATKGLNAKGFFRGISKKMTKHGKIEFIKGVNEINWWKMYSCEDINKAVKTLTDELTTILDRVAPIKVFQIRTKYAPWLSINTKQWMSF